MSNTLANLLPKWGTRGDRVHFTPGRDDRGHFVGERWIAEPCPHSCCARRAPKDRPKVSRTRRDKWGNVIGGNRHERREQQTPAGRREQRARLARMDYDAYLHAHFLAAEDATRGSMVNARGRARGIDPADFFRPGRRPSVERWGSDELRSWMGSGHVAASSRSRGAPVLSFTEFARQAKGRGRDE